MSEPSGKSGPAAVVRVLCYRTVGAGITEVPHAATSLNALSLVLPQGVYTTFRTYSGGRVLRLDDHITRLRESAALEGRSIALDDRALRQAIAAALAVSGFPLARVRVTVSLDAEISTFIALEELREPPSSSYIDGIRCGIADAALRREMPRSKSTRFIGPADAARNAEADTDELLLVDASGAILEGSTSNFFAVLDGAIRTAGEGVLSGVTRGLALSLAEGLVPIDLTPIRATDLAFLQEAFVTSVSRAVMPVTSISGIRVGDGRPGPITRALMARFADAVEQALEPIVLSGASR